MPEVEACLRKNISKKAYQLFKDLTTENYETEDGGGGGGQ